MTGAKILSTSEALVPPEGYHAAPIYKGVENDDEIREASNVTWEDQFFAHDDDVIAVFDFDYALMEDYNTKAQWAVMLFPPVFIVSSFCLHPCFLRKRVQWEVYAQHVCITRDGIRFVRDKRPTLFGCHCTDAGKSSKTIPFDMITDCDITEPAGNFCICVNNVLSTVNVDTASSGGMNQDGVVRHELTITGLKDPHNFKKLVWAMKRSNGETFAATVAGAAVGAPGAETIMRGGGTKEDVPLLLREIRDELREQTQLLKANKG